MTDLVRGPDSWLARLGARHPKKIDLSLGRLERLLGALGDPHLRLPPVVHVGGTNGKGSTCAYLRAFAEAAGLKVHVYTSPHLIRFAERIRVAGALLSDDTIEALIARCEAANGDEPITFFEMVTAAAFLAFAETPADLAIIEVGLGGKWDATNVVRPALTVMGPIDFDHMEFLGDSLTAIAKEECGIFRRGVPVVLAAQNPVAEDVALAAASIVRAPVMMLGRDVHVRSENGRLVYEDAVRLLDLPLPALAGRHQVANAGLAIAAALRLGDGSISEAAIETGLRSVRWPGRLQPLGRGRLTGAAGNAGSEVWLDGAHNPHGARAAAEAMADLDAVRPMPLFLIVGMLAKKDADGVFEAFSGLVRQVVCVPVPEAPASADPAALVAAAARHGMAAATAPDVASAMAVVGAGGPARILICGSLHLVGAVLEQDGVTVK
jgi:dihydrofolate synthase / folylpolyglutamate synthase